MPPFSHAESLPGCQSYQIQPCQISPQTASMTCRTSPRMATVPDNQFQINLKSIQRSGFTSIPHPPSINLLFTCKYGVARPCPSINLLSTYKYGVVRKGGC
ncbi:hypothetical protein LguiA_002823 [Lonicera macranthoides]